jgi:hypothetical protein
MVKVTAAPASMSAPPVTINKVFVRESNAAVKATSATLDVSADINVTYTAERAMCERERAREAT